ncbi:MAG TPA: tetratricopeptide repeat protein [Candidatus Aminicenantes bacterium]|nr:tetratricopeptide repeat protein [Candidatus Aminicenantes bacterium]
MKRIAMISITILLGTTLALFAQEGRGQGRVTGLVEDSAGNPIPGVKITMESLQYNLTLDAESAENGRWTIHGFGLGEYQFTAEKEGFVRAVSRTQLSGINRNPEQVIVLKSLDDVKGDVVKGKDAKVNFKNANDLYDAGRYEDALAMFKAFLAKNEKFYKVNINIGNCHFKLNQYDEAIAAYQRVLDGMVAEGVAMEGNATAAQVYAGIGEAFMVRDDFEKAREYFTKAIEIDPSDRALPYNVAEILFNAGNADEAVTYYRQAIEISPDWARAYRQLGYALLNQGNLEEAVVAFKTYLEKADKDDPQVDVIRDLVSSLE